MVETWLRTVFGLRNSRAAISGLLRPSASSASTSRSRAVSVAKGGGGAASVGVAKKRSSSLAIGGP
jgi:hypothetical protein